MEKNPRDFLKRKAKYKIKKLWIKFSILFATLFVLLLLINYLEK